MDRIEVDPGTGSFRTIQLDAPFDVTYSSEGEKTFKVLVRYTDGSTVENHCPIYVNNFGPSSPVARYDGNNILEEEFNATNEAGGALVTIEYAGNDQVLDKPFIVVEGFDAWRIIDPNDPDENFSFNDFIGQTGRGEGPGEINIDVDIDRLGQTINDFLEENDYDLVFVDYEDGTAAIERNAEMVENVIRWVNNQKPAGAEDNVVLGMSMGGLVARMALREMELQGEDHQTRLYISHDAPHQGANVPVAAQAAVLHLATTAIGIGIPGIYRNLTLDELTGIGNFGDFVRTFFQGGEPGDITGAAALLYAPATRQLLPYAVTITGSGFNLGYDNSAHNTFMEEYRNLGYPQQTRNVAIASGSECAPGQAFGPYAELLRLDDAFISTGWFGSLIATVAAPFTNAAPHLLAFPPLLTTRTDLRGNFILNALPSEQSRRVYKGRLFIQKSILGLFTLSSSITEEEFNSESDMLPLDSSPGGIFDIANVAELPDEILGVPLEFNHERFSFVPTTSALDIGQDGRNITPADLSARYSPTDATVNQPFDNFFTNPLANEDHIQFTLDNGRWMLDEMQQNSSVYSCLALCQGANFPTVAGPNEVCGNTTYQVNNTDGLPIRWQVNGNLTIVSGSTTNTVVVNSTGSGGGRVEAVVGMGTCTTTPFMDVQTGGMPAPPAGVSGPGQININDVYDFSVVNPQNGITYEWTVTGGNFSGPSTGSTVAVAPNCNESLMRLAVRAFDGCNRSNETRLTVGLNCNDNGEGNFLVYPNPTDQYFDVVYVEDANLVTSNSRTYGEGDMGRLKDQVKLELYNPQNSKLKTIQNKKKVNRMMVDHFKPGIYVLHIHYQGEVYQEKVAIKTK